MSLFWMDDDSKHTKHPDRHIVLQRFIWALLVYMSVCACVQECLHSWQIYKRTTQTNCYYTYTSIIEQHEFGMFAEKQIHPRIYNTNFAIV